MKKILLSLFVGLIGLINFGYCETITNYPITVQYTSTTSSSTYQENTVGIHCFNMDQSGTPGKLTINGETTILNGYRNYCVKTTDTITLSVNNVNRLQYYHFFFPYETFIGVFFPQYTSQQCQTEYDLIPSSDLSEENCRIQFGLIPYDELDTICVNGGFCSSSGYDCPVGTGDLQYSNLYINNILHPGKQNIFINIPDYITWDYSQNEVDFNVYVGSGYDVDYINSIVDINSYRPTSDDFTNVFVSGLTLVFPYIFVVLLILFIWKLIKRIFK